MDDNFSCPKGNFAWLSKTKQNKKTRRKKGTRRKRGSEKKNK